MQIPGRGSLFLLGLGLGLQPLWLYCYCGYWTDGKTDGIARKKEEPLFLLALAFSSAHLKVLANHSSLYRRCTILLITLNEPPEVVPDNITTILPIRSE